MSRTNSAPSSPIIGSRLNSPKINRSFRGEKDLGIGELTNRVRRLQTEGYKNRRDDRDDDECCHHLSVPGSPKTRHGQQHPTSHSRPSSPRTAPSSRGASPALSRTSAALSVPGSPRTRSKSPATRGLQQGGLTSSGPKRPTSLLTVAGAGSARRTPSPRTPTRSSASPSPSSPARKISARGLAPRSPATPTKFSPVDAPSANFGNSGNYDLTDPEILARIGNRAIKTVNKSNKVCDHCHVELTEDGCTAFGKVYHKDCFRCHGCKKRLDGKFFSKDENAYCAKCFKSTQEQCCVCKQKIVGDCVVNNNTYYHPGCMKCHICDEPLRGSYLFFQNKPICERDFKLRQSVCFVCENPIEGTYYELDGKVYCEEHYMSHMNDTCVRCNSPIEGEHVKITGASFHPACFKCQACQKSLVGKQFSTDDKNRVYCPECYTKLFAFICSVCSKPIVPKEGQTKAPRIRALDRDFHPQCFKCEDCGKVLDSRIKGSECWPMRHHILCYKCYRRRQSESESESED